MYTMVESPDVNQVTDQPSDEVIMNDESLNIRMVADDDGDVVGQDGEIIEDYEKIITLNSIYFLFYIIYNK